MMLPFSFSYGGRMSGELLAEWSETTTESGSLARSETTTTWRDPGTGLRVDWVVEEYAGHAVRSWRLRFTNESATPSPALVDVLAIDETVPGGAGTGWLIRTVGGSDAVVTDFEPYELALDPGAFHVFGPVGGRSTDGRRGAWPYINVDFGESGYIAALGWPGQWAMEVARDEVGALGMRGGVATEHVADGHRIGDTPLTSISLQPGEIMESPWVAVLPWAGGDWIGAQNAWRRWFVEHVMPQADGKPVAPMAPGQANDRFVGQIDTIEDELAWIDAYGAHGATAGTGGVHDHWWVDAGWYTTPEWPDPATAWIPVGTWEPDPERFPDGFLPLSQRAHELGMSSIVWFEPERIMPGTWLAETHPDWLFEPDPAYPHFDGTARVFDFGNPEALRWAIDYFSAFIAANGIDVYREDHNISPLTFWNAAETDGERGHRQIRSVLGHLDFWRGLLERHPGLVIDSCASGGRRLDLLTSTLSLPLLRSDWVHDATGNQAHTYGASLWIPYTGTGDHFERPGADGGYAARSAMAPSYLLTINAVNADADWEGFGAVMTEWAAVAPSYLADFHPLTPYSVDPAEDLAFQFGNAETGFVQAFRRPESASVALDLSLRGLDEAASYELHDFAANRTWTVPDGAAHLTVAFDRAPAAVTISYRRLA